MRNYEVPKPTPAEALKARFDHISGQDLDGVTIISQSLDAIADAIRLFVDDPDTLRSLADQVSVSAYEVATRAGVAPPPAPKPRRGKAAEEGAAD